MSHSINGHNRANVANPLSKSGLRNVSYRKEAAIKGWACWYGRLVIQGTVYRTGLFRTPEAASAAIEEIRNRRVTAP